jgi:hypothetical protein
MNQQIQEALRTTDPEERWTADEHAEMALLVITNNMPTEEREKFLADLDVSPAEYEYLTEKFSRPLSKLTKHLKKETQHV